LRQPRHVDWRAVLGILLMLVATGASMLFWMATSDTRSVVVATRDLPAGSTLGPADLAITRVRVDDSIYAAAIPGSAIVGLSGQSLGEPIHANQILARAQVSSHPRLGPDQLALTIPISPDSAVGGALQPGDDVEVLLTIDKGKPEAKTAVVLPRVTVYDVGHASAVGGVNVDLTHDAVSASTVRWLTLIVSQDQAVSLVRAKWAGEVDVALLPPAQGADRGQTLGP